MSRLFSALSAALLAALLLGAAAPDHHNGWTDLFDGESLDGWRQLNGSAKYHVEDGQIVGVSVADSPNSFLCHEEEVGDFILEFDVRVDPSLNSGVQIRSLSLPEFRDGRVHGYQVELDPSPRAWTGGIYDEARRGWLYNLTRNEKARQAYRFDGWNTIRVEAVGPEISTWVNGVQAARLVDDMTPEGLLCLQVHGIGNNLDRVGKEIRWDNIRIMTGDLEAVRTRPDPDVEQISYLNNELTEWEKRQGWRLLWDGETSDGWRGARLDHFPEQGWTIRDGMLIVHDTDESVRGGDIVTENVFGDFELELDFMITEGANSGIKYYVMPEVSGGPGSSIGLEYQILHDAEHPDAANGVGGNRMLGSLYDLIPAENLSIPGGRKRFNGVGDWNRARIVARDNRVEHWLNGEKVVEYARDSQAFRALVQKSKYESLPNFGLAPVGHILLQDHGDRVAFRNIKIREF